MALRYMLDSNACICLIARKSGYAKLAEKITALEPEEIGLSTIVVAELRYGVSKSAHKKTNAEALEQFLLPFLVTPFDESASNVYGDVRAELEAKGKTIGPLDTLIAAHALSVGVVLVTDNLREFSRVPGLKVENWLRR